ncbi:hypothetical protein ACO0LB_11855 [Undibacterium sp. SXout7W]|uniref:hypothetical protein n=1 Tax=Undibacterium sp. SXout7W TaxID=3413049 RepID=UPI003BF11629
MKKFISVVALLIMPMLANADNSHVETDKGTITALDIPQDAPKFESYVVTEIFQGKPALPKTSTSPAFKNMRTKIREGAKTGPNFAGHYTLIFVGCGAGAICLPAIVDAKTGNVYSSDFINSIENFNIAPDIENHIVEYRKDSSLLRVIGSINENTELRGVSYFVWENNKFKRIRFVQHPS